LYTSNISKRGGASVNVANIFDNQTFVKTHALNSQKQTITSDNPFINLSNKVFESNNVTSELLQNYDNYTQQVNVIINTYIQAVNAKKVLIEQYVDDVFTSDVGSIFYLMTQLTYYKENLVSQVGGKRHKRIQYGGGKLTDFLTKTVKNYDELPLSKKLFYVEHISVELMGFLLNKFLVFVGLFEIDITKISSPYEFLKEIEAFINNILFEKLNQCITKSNEKEKTLSNIIQETKSWIKISLNVHRVLGLISLILSYVPENSPYFNSVAQLMSTIEKEKEMLGAVKKALVNKSKYLQEILTKNGDMKITDMINSGELKNVLSMSAFESNDIEDINYDIKCILSQSFDNITTVFETYADVLKDVKFDSSAKLKILTIFQKIGHSYNSRIVRQLFTGLTKGLTKMHKFIDKAQARVLSKVVVGTQAVFLNAMFMYGPLMINGMLLVLWGCTKGCMFIHKLKKQRQMVMPVSDEIWQRMLIEENDKANLIDKIKQLVGNNSELLSKIDIEDSVKNIPEYVENNVQKAFVNDVKNHDFSVVIDNYTYESNEILNQAIEELEDELPEEVSDATLKEVDGRATKCTEFSKEASITIRVPSIVNEQIQNEIEDIYKDELVKRHFSTTENDVVNILAASHTRKIASAWLSKTNKVINFNDTMENNQNNEVNGEVFIESLQRKPSVCTPKLTSLLRTASVTSQSLMSDISKVPVSLRQQSVMSNRQQSITSNRQPSINIPRLAIQSESDEIAKLTELTLRSVVKFKKLGQVGGKKYNSKQKKEMFLFLDKFSKLQLQQYAREKQINATSSLTKKQLISQIISYRAKRRI